MPIMTKSLSGALLGVVVPTLGTRANYLLQCLRALPTEKISVVLVGPESVREMLKQENLHFDDFLIEDPSDSLATSINKAIKLLPDSVPFVTWIGDDDVINAEEMLQAIEGIVDEDNVVVVYGDCNYIDEYSQFLWKNVPGIHATQLISLLPQRISQPASAIRHSAWRTIGGLNPTYTLAFDYDLFIRLSKVGSFQYKSVTLASYRWHSDALSVKSRRVSVLEAHKVRHQHRSRLLKLVLFPFEVVVVIMTYFFGSWMKLRLKTSQ